MTKSIISKSSLAALFLWAWDFQRTGQRRCKTYKKVWENRKLDPNGVENVELLNMKQTYRRSLRKDCPMNSLKNGLLL
ncbi:hypothetical protein EJ377_00715 [Chryseobacterium arthrosphaerae]|uniref:Uncharacterized protein n=1 Tax=Chryseobacterium arthrosphaerae TaxID=651561 RepID=A0A432DYJ0_9FLAO|nr:hypothetical protein EJ377_00715 [Chryseobacterium arthrosphaerae]